MSNSWSRWHPEHRYWGTGIWRTKSGHQTSKERERPWDRPRSCRIAESWGSDNIWQAKTALDNWKVGHYVKLQKKGDVANTNRWRGIMLLSVNSKVLNRVILTRMASVSFLRKEQVGLIKGNADLIFSLRQILEPSNEWKNTLCMPISLILSNIWQFALFRIMENRHALWHPRQDHLHHKIAENWQTAS